MSSRARLQFERAWKVLWYVIACNFALVICVATNGLGTWLGLGLREPDSTHTYPMEYRRRGQPLFYTPVVGKALDTYIYIGGIGTPVMVFCLVVAGWYFGRPSRRGG